MFNEMAYTWIYTYFHTPALHAALPIVYFLAAGILAAGGWLLWHGLGLVAVAGAVAAAALYAAGRAGVPRALAKIVEILRAMAARSEEHTSELQSLMRISYDVFCLKQKTTSLKGNQHTQIGRLSQ